MTSAAGEVRKSRQLVSEDNIFWQAQQQFAEWMENSLDVYRDLRDHSQEALFHAVYGSPFIQALVGLKASDAPARPKPSKDAAHHAFVARRIEELKRGITEGGPREAVIRALLYIRMPEGVVDERGFNLLRNMREETGKGLTLAAFKKLLREQFFMLLLDERRAIEAIPAMLAKDPHLAARMAAKLHQVIEVVGSEAARQKPVWPMSMPCLNAAVSVRGGLAREKRNWRPFARGGRTRRASSTSVCDQRPRE